MPRVAGKHDTDHEASLHDLAEDDEKSAEHRLNLPFGHDLNHVGEQSLMQRPVLGS
jgi:hypothetical protein